jgi:hypothetical protein
LRLGSQEKSEKSEAALDWVKKQIECRGTKLRASPRWVSLATVTGP